LVTMKFNISYPTTGAQKTIEVDDERKIRNFIDKRLSAEVDGEALGDQFKGYVFKITGGNDKQGFCMTQGVMTNQRIRLLLTKNSMGYRPRRDGERRKRSVRGCITGPDLSVLNLVIVKKGPAEIPEFPTTAQPRRLGPKRASKLRKLFNLTKEDDVRKFVIRRDLPTKEGKTKKRVKSVKIQRLVTPVTLHRKKRRIALKKARHEENKKAAAEYARLLALRSREARQALVSKKRGISERASEKKSETKPAATKPAKAAKPAAAKPAATKPAAAAAKPAAAKPAATATKPAAAKPAATATKPAAAKPAKK